MTNDEHRNLFEANNALLRDALIDLKNKNWLLHDVAHAARLLRNTFPSYREWTTAEIAVDKALIASDVLSPVPVKCSVDVCQMKAVIIDEGFQMCEICLVRRCIKAETERDKAIADAGVTK